MYTPADIDFGHFLGNFKTKTVGGIKVRRERAPFVFTPQVNVPSGVQLVSQKGTIIRWGNFLLSTAFGALSQRKQAQGCALRS